MIMEEDYRNEVRIKKVSMVCSRCNREYKKTCTFGFMCEGTQASKEEIASHRLIRRSLRMVRVLPVFHHHHALFSFLLGLWLSTSTRGSSDGSGSSSGSGGGSGSGSGTTGYRGKKRRREGGGTHLHWSLRLRLEAASDLCSPLHCKRQGGHCHIVGQYVRPLILQCDGGTEGGDATACGTGGCSAQQSNMEVVQWVEIDMYILILLRGILILSPGQLPHYSARSTGGGGACSVT